MNTQALGTGRPTDDELVARVHALGELIREQAAKGDRKRRVPEPVIAALNEAGAFKLATPRRYGGYETSMKTMLDVASAVGEYDGSTAWLVSLISACNWIAGLFPIQAQDEIWGENPDARVCGVFAPTSKSVKVDGGFLVTGKWYYTSGAWHAEWGAMGMPIVDENGQQTDYGFGLIPMSDMTQEDTWFTVGMRATGSICVAADNVFVPAHRIVSGTEANEGHNRNENIDNEPLYRSAFQPLLILVLIAPQLGLSRAALEFVKEQAATKRVHATVYEPQAGSVAIQLRLARAKMRVDTARLHAYRAAEDVDRAANEGRYPDFETRARIQADCGWVAENAREAIDMLITAHGAGSFAERNPLGRIWRDSNTAGRHAFITPDVRYEIYGKAMLGIEEKIVPLI